MSNLLAEGLNLAMFGMGFVFSFLLMLVVLTTAMSAILRRFTPSTAVAPKGYASSGRNGRAAASPRAGSNQQTVADDPRLLAVITAAIRKHRSDVK
ncbi:MAG: OadG family protein [Pseudohongiella sp.]|nr:OadG family protein [Pseudohongiella sp.]MDO9520098.1 OadG family protein [Pseudohongiella sp.]MDP2128003.1 OadG family protein [Pseudohongiella sp.]